MSFEEVCDSGWRVTNHKIKIDKMQPPRDMKYESLETRYGTANDHESVVLMPCPSKADLMHFLTSHDLNPLLQLEMQQSLLSCHTESYVNPRRNRERKMHGEYVGSETQYINLAIRDPIKIDKLRVIKTIQALVHRRLFIFYTR